MKTAQLLRWSARLLSLALTALFVVFVIGQWPPVLPLSTQTLSFALLAICLTGLLVAWRFEAVGVALGLFGSVGFYLTEFYRSGFQSFPGGWVFPMLIVGSLLYAAARVLERRPVTRRTDAGWKTVS